MTVPSIAYFTMEISLDPNLPTYAGGLGVLAGDTIRSAADLGLPMVAVSLLYRKGYVEQRLDEHGHTTESEVQFSPEHFLTEQAFRVAVQVEGRIVDLRSWCYPVQGVLGHTVPVYFLDADLPENDERDRRLTDRLYGGDERYRLSQEVVLGIGGVRLLRALGLYDLRRYHMNEGHAALLTLELLEEEAARNEHPSIGAKEIEAVRSRCVFTTHTPVRAGHDHFPRALVREVLGSRSHLFDLEDPQCREMLDRVFPGDEGSGASAGPGPDLNLTYLALNLSCYVNAVAEKHGEVSRRMFSGYEIDSITNGVHALTWTNPHFREVFDRHLPGWREDNFRLRCAMTIPAGDIWESHQRSKEELCELVRERTGTVLSPEVLTLGFARRATAYKRPDLLLTDLDRLQRIAAEGGGLQMVFAGKAHPRDHEGKNLIRQIFAARAQLESDPSIKIVYLENYGTALSLLMTSGVDIWLNTPEPPNEASGTSGMKAALNGVPSLSVLDGWWIEGHIEGVTGWSIGDDDQPRDRRVDAESLYQKLEAEVLPIYTRDRSRFLDIMRQAIAINGSYFNTQRMVQEYVTRAYLG